jgi:hypothetical protein
MVPKTSVVPSSLPRTALYRKVCGFDAELGAHPLTAITLAAAISLPCKGFAVTCDWSQEEECMSDVRGIHQCIMLCMIPVIAITIAARQLYLSVTDDLSTWKGGGMGMFASSEALTRYAKIYLILDGRVTRRSIRQPLLRITGDQEKLQIQALNYPNEKNMRVLAESVKATVWSASTTRVPLNVFGEDGEMVREGTEQLYDLYEGHQRHSDEQADFGVEIEYWNATYDLATKEYAGTLVRTFKLDD